MKKYLIEQINVSDSEYKITDLNTNIDIVKSGDILFSYESSKATYDSISENNGFLYFNPKVKLGNNYKVGDIIAIVVEEKISDDEKKSIFNPENNISKINIEKSDFVITKKAKYLIEKNNIDLKSFHGVEVITEEVILNFIKKNKFGFNFQSIDFYYSNSFSDYFNSNKKKLAIIGAGKAALQLLDSVFENNEYLPIFFYDQNPSLLNKKILEIPIINHIDIDLIYKDYKDNKFDEIIISFSGDKEMRMKIFEQLLSKNIPIANVIHSSAIISKFSKIGKGNLIFANSRIGPFTVIGDNNVISSYCSIEHHNYLGSHNTFGPTVITSGSCTIGDCNRFGTGIFIEPNIKIGSNCIISSGLILTNSVSDNKLLRNLSKIEYKDI